MPYYQVTAKLFVEYGNLPWELAERVFWFWPFLAISIISAYLFTRSWVGVLIYVTNTYVLMLVGGGQMGVSMAYAFAPLACKVFIDLCDMANVKIKNIVIGGIVFGLMIMFDPRIFYILTIAYILYVFFSVENLFSVGKIKKNVLKVLYLFIVPIVLAILINLFWILPFLQSPLLIETNTGGNELWFFSFADFSHVLSLLHPNWPENIFGKTYFLRPEFLFIPILAFLPLLISFNTSSEISREKKRILYFSLLALVGVFLAKGVNAPFGQVNEFIFTTIPGMKLFRDPTKFYLLISLSYAYLIPISLKELSAFFIETVKKIKRKTPAYSAVLFCLSIVFLLYWGFTIREAVFGKINGTFLPEPLPTQYKQVKELIQNDSSFYQTLWIPQYQRFGLTTKNHPALSGKEYFHIDNPKDMLEMLNKKEIILRLKQEKIRYIIVPYDAKQEIFLEDRKYDYSQYLKTVKKIQTIPTLSNVTQFGEIMVFTIK